MAQAYSEAYYCPQNDPQQKCTACGGNLRLVYECTRCSHKGVEPCSRCGGFHNYTSTSDQSHRENSGYGGGSGRQRSGQRSSGPKGTALVLAAKGE